MTSLTCLDTPQTGFSRSISLASVLILAATAIDVTLALPRLHLSEDSSFFALDVFIAPHVFGGGGYKERDTQGDLALVVAILPAEAIDAYTSTLSAPIGTRSLAGDKAPKFWCRFPKSSAAEEVEEVDAMLRIWPDTKDGGFTTGLHSLICRIPDALRSPVASVTVEIVAEHSGGQVCVGCGAQNTNKDKGRREDAQGARLCRDFGNRNLAGTGTLVKA